MFIQALKTAAKKGKSDITPENVQKAAANQTWQIKGLAGPTTYPQSTVSAYPACSAEVLSDGTAWKHGRAVSPARRRRTRSSSPPGASGCSGGEQPSGAAPTRIRSCLRRATR